MIKSNIIIQKRTWSDVELQKLIELIRVHGKDLEKICENYLSFSQIRIAHMLKKVNKTLLNRIKDPDYNS